MFPLPRVEWVFTDSFGILLRKTGSTENNYLYTGEQYEPNTGFYYLRARYMNPEMGRFITTDPYQGRMQEPMTLHKYLYAGQNPVMNRDPSGEFFASVMTTFAISGVLNQIPVKESLKHKTLRNPSFSLLDKNYPSTNTPCTEPWGNQCSIRMSIALEGAGMRFCDYSGTNLCKHGHIRGAESLANYLWRRMWPPFIYFKGADAKTKHKNDQGIIFFKNCFTRQGQSQRFGDHIDLWDKGITKGYNDPANISEEVWFWKLRP